VDLTACLTAFVALGTVACTLTPEADVGDITTSSSGEASTSAVDPSTSAATSTGADGGASTSAGTTTSEPAGTTEASTTDDDPPILLDVSVDTEGAESCASDSPDVIFVMRPSTPTEIWSYDPTINEFEPFTTVECDEVLGEFTGFSLDRDGYVVLLSREPQDPDVFPQAAMQVTRFDPVSGACEELFYGPMTDGQSSVDCADLAFVSRPDDPDQERLFAHSCTGGGFTMIPEFEVGRLFRMDLDDQDPEFGFLDGDNYTSVALAGTGDGRLYGVGGDQKLPGIGQIIEYDQESGAILSNETVPDLDIGGYGAYIALAFYGGDLYTFGLSNEDLSLQIRRYDLDDDDGNGQNEVTVIETPPSAPGGVIAAASPTCIPLTPAG